jgi:quinol monooxygenase YgiN
VSITTITQFHAAPDQENLLGELLAEGRERMRAAEGCESFELVPDESDARSLTFIQHWASHQARDSAFGERIMKAGHLDKVIATRDPPIVQPTYAALSSSEFSIVGRVRRGADDTTRRRASARNGELTSHAPG